MRHVLLRSLLALVCLAAFVGLGWIGKAWWDSRLPGTYNVMDYGGHDYGGGAVPVSHVEHGGGTSVADLRGPREGKPDARFRLTAKRSTIRLASGRELDALTFDGRAPGPELRVTQDDLVEVTFVNEDVEAGVTIHWHGLDVPNGEDGVAGVTQDAVLPGERHVYRFRAEQVGTFWYHTHQVSSKEVRRGLFGVLVVEPRETTYEVDLALAAHTFEGVPTLNANDGVLSREIAPGTDVRLRLVNTDSTPHSFYIDTFFFVLALDGTDLNAPTVLDRQIVEVGGGGRVDVAISVPYRPVWVELVDTDAVLAINADGKRRPILNLPERVFDLATYGQPAPTPFDAETRYDRRFDLTITQKPGFLDGKPGRQWAVNGKIYPDVPVFVVEEGDLVHVTIENETDAVHPMHLHGHHVLVLSRDGEPVSGSPWWADTLNVKGGERYEVAFRADNPGIWMDHCHNLRHAADGLTMHVAYDGVFTPFNVGDAHHNAPE